jgi:predicted O-methyltransferase YrrM
MSRTVLRYLQKAPQAARYIATDPLEVWLRLLAKFFERRERLRPPPCYEVDRDWESRLHANLGIPWPCPAIAEFRALWPEVMESLRSKGLGIGIGFFGGFNDGEPELVRAIWCLTRHLMPAKVVETGVARGVSSRFILEALERNRGGHLWSIDQPPPLDPELNEQVGAAVDDHCRRRWSYIHGSSRRRLPGLVASLGSLDLFVHDSIHTEYNTRFELEQAWRVLKPGGVLVADDIDLNHGFQSFLRAHSGHPFFVCRARPLQSDPSRFEGGGLFGILQKSGPGVPSRPLATDVDISSLTFESRYGS